MQRYPRPFRMSLQEEFRLPVSGRCEVPAFAGIPAAGIRFFSLRVPFALLHAKLKITLTSRQHHVINRYNILSAINANAKWCGIKMSSNEIDELYIKLQPLKLKKLKNWIIFIRYRKNSLLVMNINLEKMIQRHNLPVDHRCSNIPPCGAGQRRRVTKTENKK